MGETVTFSRPPERFALRDVDDRVDGEGLTWWLYLPGPAGVPHLGEHALEKAQQNGWWRVPAWVDFDPGRDGVELVRSPGRTLSHWRLCRSDVVGKPETLTADEFSAACDDEDERYDPLVRAAYEPVYVELPDTRTLVEGEWIVLDGAPPPADGHHWHAQIPHALRHAPEYHHLFPGHLEGFRKALSDALDPIPGVSAYASGQGPIKVYVKVTLPKPTPLERWASPPDYRGKNARERRLARERHGATAEAVTRTLEIPVFDRVAGTDRAAAVRAWDAMIADAVGYVEHLIAEPCPHCRGRGWVEPANHEEER